MSAYDFAQWFEATGKCRCGKPATGILRSFYGNSSLGAHCKPCADKAIKAAHRKGKWEPDAALEGSRP